MVDLKTAIREMLTRGMSETQVKENLTQMGVADPELIFQQATQNLKSIDITPQNESSEQQNPDEEEQAEQTAISENQPTQLIKQGLDEKSMETLNDAIALLKSVEDLNRKILETNREILLRLK